MEVIHSNPFRILDIPVDATPKAINKQINDFKLYAELGKPIRCEVDYKFLPPVDRSPQVIAEACRKIEQPESRFQYALFWFWNINSVDQVALDLLALGNLRKAESLWLEEVKDGEISNGKFSCAKNLFTLYLACASGNGSLDKGLITSGIRYAGLCLQSEHLEDYSERLSVVKYSLDRERLLRAFVDQSCALARRYLRDDGGFTVSEFLQSFDGFPREGRLYIRNKFAGQPIQRIEQAVSSSSATRKADRLSALKNAEHLIGETKKDLRVLRETLGPEDVQYRMIADKVANELLQSSVDYFNEIQERDPHHDPGPDVLALVKKANKIAVGERVREQARNSLRQIEEWCEGADERAQQAAVIEPLEKLAGVLSSIHSSGFAAVNSLLNQAEPLLGRIRSALGPGDEVYLAVSSRVAMDALNMVVETVNQLHARAAAAQDLGAARTACLDAQRCVARINRMDMVPQARQNVTKNSQQLDQITADLAQVHSQVTQAPSGGCYIATAVYGDYDHPSVCILRNFRDRRLVPRRLGRSLVQLYYSLSPALASRLHPSSRVTRCTRRLLDAIVIFLEGQMK